MPKNNKIITKPARLTSLDALRGFDMFFIIGGGVFLVALLRILQLPNTFIELIEQQLTHVQWEGFNFYDLIFPLFVFLAGVSIPFAIIPSLDKGLTKSELQLKISKRTLILFLIGLSFSFFNFQENTLRIYTVLWLIAASYFIAATLTLHIKSWKTLLVLVVIVLVLYHLAIQYLPYPGKGSEITPSNNLAAWLDRILIKTNLYKQTYDPEGTIRVISSGMLCLLGSLAGRRIRFYKEACVQCTKELVAFGLIFLLGGWVWSFFFPIIKDIWSPSFILWSAGWSLLILALFYQIMDVAQQRWFGWIFVPIGVNSITIYAGQRYIDFEHTSNYFFSGVANLVNDIDSKLFILAFGLIFIKWMFLYSLQQKKIFIKV